MNDVERELLRKRQQLAKSPTARMLKAHRVGEVLVARIFSFFGDNEEDLKTSIGVDPYCLIDVPGVSLKRADSIAVRVGLKRDKLAPLRNNAILKIVLRENTSFGNVYLPYGILMKKAKKEMTRPEVLRALGVLVDNGSIVFEKGVGGRDDLIYLSAYYEAEVGVADLMRERLEFDYNE